MSKKKIIEEKLLQDREISNYWCIKNGITTRLAVYVDLLRKQGLDIKTTMHGNECIYRLPSNTLF